MNNVKNTDKKEMIAISSFFYYPMKRCTIGVTINRYKNRKKHHSKRSSIFRLDINQEKAFFCIKTE